MLFMEIAGQKLLQLIENGCFICFLHRFRKSIAHLAGQMRQFVSLFNVSHKKCFMIQKRQLLSERSRKSALEKTICVANPWVLLVKCRSSLFASALT